MLTLKLGNSIIRMLSLYILGNLLRDKGLGYACSATINLCPLAFAVKLKFCARVKRYGVVVAYDILVENDGRGTFFFTGRSLKQNGFALPQYALDNGFEVANHSYNHASLKEADYDTSVFEIVGVNDLYAENIGVTPKYFRGGGFTTGVNMWKVLGEQDMIAIAASRGGSGDHAGGSATVDGLVDRLSPEKLSDGEIVCMHSTNKTGVTPDALAIVLPRLYAEGYRFCTLSELFAFKGVDLKDVPRGEYIKKVQIGDNGLVIFN